MNPFGPIWTHLLKEGPKKIGCSTLAVAVLGVLGLAGLVIL